MASEVKAGESSALSPNPVYYEVSPRTVIVLRVFGGVAAFLMFLAVIFCFVMGADDAVMYLLAVNLIVSSIIGGIIAWWYHKGLIGRYVNIPRGQRLYNICNCKVVGDEYTTIYLCEANKVTFMVFLGLCIIFQAITSDIYVFHRVPQGQRPTSTPLIPTTNSSVNYTGV